MNLPREEIKARLVDRYTAAELADVIELDTGLFLDYFLDECIQYIDAMDIEEILDEYGCDQD